MPYGEKLKLIKKEKQLTNAAISKICSVSLPTVTRLFDEKNLSGNFETFVALAKGLNFSLDELAGLKPPVASPTLDLLAEKDAQIKKLTEENDALHKYAKEIHEDNKELRKDNKSLRREKIKVVGVLVALLTALAIWIGIDLVNGHFGIFRY